MLLQVHDELVFEVPDGREEEAAAVIKQRDGERGRARRSQLDVPLDVEVGWGRTLGRSALSDARGAQVLAETAATPPDADMATLARGGRLNVFGFVLRLAGMVPFLFIGGRIYGAAALGRFAYAVLVGRIRGAARRARAEARPRAAARQCEEAAVLRRRRCAARRRDRLGVSEWRS